MHSFMYSYLEAAIIFTDVGENGLLEDYYTFDDLSPETLSKIREDCWVFRTVNADDIGTNYEQAGYDFWLTRNGHGAGFWDGDWPEPAASRLTDAARKFGEFSLYVGDDGKIHHTS